MTPEQRDEIDSMWEFLPDAAAHAWLIELPPPSGWWIEEDDMEAATHFWWAKDATEGNALRVRERRYRPVEVNVVALRVDRLGPGYPIAVDYFVFPASLKVEDTPRLLTLISRRLVGNYDP